jgi:hypothetical protein
MIGERVGEMRQADLGLAQVAAELQAKGGGGEGRDMDGNGGEERAGSLSVWRMNWWRVYREC